MVPQRILIIGISGAGKSTLARMLGERFQLPITHLDNLAHEPGWIPKDDVAIKTSLAALAAQPRWVTDGNYHRLSASLRARADWFIFLDYSTPYAICQVVKRFLSHHLKLRQRPDLAPGFQEELSWSFLRWVWRWRRDSRPKWVNELAQHPAEKVHIFTSRGALMRWVNSL